MTNNYDELISSFEDKLRELISEYESLKNENASLDAKLSELSAKLSEKEHELSESKENYNHLRMAKSLNLLNLSPRERKISKQYIDKLVREIDKCLALLDE